MSKKKNEELYDKNSRRFHVLLEKENTGKLTQAEASELMELDTFIENYLCPKYALSHKLKIEEYKIEEYVVALINSTNKLLKSLSNQKESKEDE